ncbi:WXG100 family type VII secretion target [Aldersonia sp. NBC_00410]|uniref:WXG100 family type VII secretion target n=1 Tax=Aldersonia sp. NBC_00410 TaxID=2975954 RepID=UPI00224D512B|nr:WXG100 family type VII secretion target [Aldersonia sp. NBC_00410]MCX5046295.1 WXG100 family type VII secretion target [Aldersonia sp. NBC_00410]
MLYNYGGIASASADLGVSHKALNTNFEDMQGTVVKLKSSWDSTGALSWQDAQTRLGSTITEVNAALLDMSVKLGEAGIEMAKIDALIATRFV